MNPIRPIDCLFAPQISDSRNPAMFAALPHAPCSTNVASILEAMDRYGIERVLLTPCRIRSAACDRQYLCGDPVLSEQLHVVSAYSTRFSALIGYNAHEISDSLRGFDEAAAEHDVKGLFVSNDTVPFLDRRMYPAYAKCAELRVPVVMSAHDEVRRSTPGQMLDEVRIMAGDFPQLTIVMACGHWPGIEAAHRLLDTRENAYLAMDANPRREQIFEMCKFLNSDLGRSRCVWGSNGEEWSTALAQLRELGLEEQALWQFASENAIRIFALQHQRRPQPEVNFVLTAE